MADRAVPAQGDVLPPSSYLASQNASSHRAKTHGEMFEVGARVVCLAPRRLKAQALRGSMAWMAKRARRRRS